MIPMRSLLVATTAIFLGAGGLAYAQQPAPPAASQTGALPALVEVENEAMVVQPFNLTVDQLEDMVIHGSAGERIGEIEEVLMTPAGEITAVSVEVGGFLGIGGKEVIVRLDQLQHQGDRLVMAMTKAQIEALPAWGD